MAVKKRVELFNTLEAAAAAGRTVAEVSWVLSKGLIPVPRTISGVRVWTREDVDGLQQVFEDLDAEDDGDADEEGDGQAE